MLLLLLLKKCMLLLLLLLLKGLRLQLLKQKLLVLQVELVGALLP